MHSHAAPDSYERSTLATRPLSAHAPAPHPRTHPMPIVQTANAVIKDPFSGINASPTVPSSCRPNVLTNVAVSPHFCPLFTHAAYLRCNTSYLTTSKCPQMSSFPI